jgi:serine/threonine protein kinase/tetratricopeptide (TPR) repeat protein
VADLLKEARRAQRRGDYSRAGDLCDMAGYPHEAIQMYVQGKQYLLAGQVAARIGEYAAAAGYYASGGDFPAAADMYVKAGQRKKASLMYERGGQFLKAAEIEEKMGNLGAAAAYYDMAGQTEKSAYLYAQSGDNLKAAALYEALLAASNPDPSASGAYSTEETRKRRARYARFSGILYYKAGKYEKAGPYLEEAGLFDQAVEAYKKSSHTERAAHLLVRLENYAEALRIVEEDPATKIDKRLLGELLLRAGQFARAAETFLEANLPFKAAECFESAGDPARAAELFAAEGEAIRAADLYASIGRHEQAALLYEQGKEYVNAARSYVAAGRPPEGVRTYLLAGRPTAAAEIHLQNGQESEAIRLLQQVRKEDAEFGRAAYLLGTLFARQSLHQLAAEKFEAAVRGASDETQRARSLYQLGLAYEQMGRAEEARRAYERVLSIDYHHADVAERLKRLAQQIAAARPSPAQVRMALARGQVPGHAGGAAAPPRATPLPGTLTPPPGATGSGPAPAGTRSSGASPASGGAALPSRTTPLPGTLTMPPRATPLPGTLTVPGQGATPSGPVAAAQPAALPPITARLDVVQSIGRGTHGEVLEAFDRALRRRVAVRHLPASTGQPDIYGRFLAEAQKASELLHPNVVTVFGTTEDADGRYIIMDLVEGRTLREVLEDKVRLEPARILSFAQQMAEALAHAHKKGILHRDLRPENIFIVGEETVRLSDFGLKARASDTAATEGARVCYAPPEQIRGERVDAQSDLYTLGVVVYEMLLGEPPFPPETASFDHLNTPPSYPQKVDRVVPAFLRKIISRCLEKDRSRRYRSATLLIDDIRASGIVPGVVVADRYEIVRELGIGGMGRVYQAVDRDLDEVVAIKVLRGTDAEGKQAERFLREIKITRRIAHANVVKVYDLGAWRDHKYITMEFIDGINLEQWRRLQPSIEIPKAVRMMIDVARGLESAHALGIIHRDIKPQNILVKEDGTPKILDFGIARGGAAGDSDLTTTGFVMGSPKYMSPEQVQAMPLDLRTDVYSLGVVMYFLFTGREPFIGETATGIAQRHLSEAPRPPVELNAEIPAYLQAVIFKALEKDRERRFANMGELAAALEAGLAGTTGG